jgi:transcriptional regulator with XRE-family HTH domain
MRGDPATVAAGLGETVRRERRARGLSQDDLALAAGLGLRAVNDVEAGKATAHLATWVKALDALDMDVAAVARRRRS